MKCSGVSWRGSKRHVFCRAKPFIPRVRYTQVFFTSHTRVCERASMWVSLLQMWKFHKMLLNSAQKDRNWLYFLSLPSTPCPCPCPFNAPLYPINNMIRVYTFLCACVYVCVSCIMRTCFQFRIACCEKGIVIIFLVAEDDDNNDRIFSPVYTYISLVEFHCLCLNIFEHINIVWNMYNELFGI